jgi:PAS domain S-box-containing protein
MAALISALGISLVFTPIPDVHFFVAALLAGIAINTALVRPYFRAGTDIKLTMLAIAGIGLRARPILDPNTIFVTSLFFEAAVAILAMTVIMFAGQVERAFERQLDMERAMAERASDLRRSKAEIAKTGIMNQRLALAAQPANDAIVFTDQNHRYTWVNQAFTRITGFTPEQAIGQFPGDLLNAAETLPETLERLGEARKNNAAVRVEIFNRNQKGRGYWVDTSIIPILDDEGRLITSLSIERDITQAKEREAELARAREAAEAAARAKSRFLANMSHEIRTPMNGVIGVADLLAETRLTALQRDFVATVLESGRALLRMINDILDLSKLQSGKIVPENEPF